MGDLQQGISALFAVPFHVVEGAILAGLCIMYVYYKRVS